MHTYKVHLPKNNHWHDEYDTWIETSFYKGRDNAINNNGDDIYGTISNGTSLDEIPLLIGETDEITIID
jgi:hypothetical protein